MCQIVQNDLGKEVEKITSPKFRVGDLVRIVPHNFRGQLTTIVRGLVVDVPEISPVGRIEQSVISFDSSHVEKYNVDDLIKFV